MRRYLKANQYETNFYRNYTLIAFRFLTLIFESSCSSEKTMILSTWLHTIRYSIESAIKLNLCRPRYKKEVRDEAGLLMYGDHSPQPRSSSVGDRFWYIFNYISGQSRRTWFDLRIIRRISSNITLLWSFFSFQSSPWICSIHPWAWIRR